MLEVTTFSIVWKEAFDKSPECNLTNIQLAIRAYMKLAGIEQIVIQKLVGYENKTQLNISIQKNNELFMKWLKDNNKKEEFINSVLDNNNEKQS